MATVDSTPPVTLAQLRTVTEWNLSNDAELAVLLSCMSSKFQLTAKATAGRLMDLCELVDNTRVDVRSTVNELLMLSDSQFIENRVYDEAEDDDKPPVGED